MKLTAFRVQNYRSIIDSGWVRLDDIAVIVGKNESGKTSLLKALWKFKPFKAEPYSLDREWPRGNRRQRSLAFEVVTARFALTGEQQMQLSAIDPSFEGVEGVEIGKTYEGKMLPRYLPHPIASHRNGASALWLLEGAITSACQSRPPELHQALTEVVHGYQHVLAKADAAEAIALVPEIRNQLVEAARRAGDPALVDAIAMAADAALARLSGSLWDEAWRLVDAWIPTFTYMDDFLAFKGTAFLDQVKARRDLNQLQDDDLTIMTIMQMAGLDLDAEVEKAYLGEREQRMLDMSDASQTLTNEIAARWSQKKYEVQFVADGNHFVTFVKDETTKALVPLEERSKGFQWFFSFDMRFMYETEGKFKGSVILLDEPGLHLHAAAQRDLLARLKAYSSQNQLIYTTHLPFMIDMTRTDNIWVAEERGNLGTKVHEDWATAGEDARFTLQAALGLSWATSLFGGRKNLVVESVETFWLLTAMSSLFRQAGEAGLHSELIVTPAGGAAKVAYIATLLAGNKLRVVALLDSDEAALVARRRLDESWLLRHEDVLLLGELMGREGTFGIEDLFDRAFYVQQAQAAYVSELGGVAIEIPAEFSGSIVDQVTHFFASNGQTFHKARVAKRIVAGLAGSILADVAPSTVDGFRKVIAAVNSVVYRWPAALP